MEETYIASLLKCRQLRGYEKGILGPEKQERELEMSCMS